MVNESPRIFITPAAGSGAVTAQAGHLSIIPYQGNWRPNVQAGRTTLNRLLLPDATFSGWLLDDKKAVNTDADVTGPLWVDCGQLHAIWPRALE